MPDPNPFSASDDPNPDDYQILRKGSVYNITGPYGREFGSYRSASIVGPRWEELTHTPWPYESSAYTPGMRLWELGLIQREHVGLRKLLTRSDPVPPAPAKPATPPTETPDQAGQQDHAEHEPEPDTESPPEPKSAPKSVRQPPRESASMQRASKPVQQALRPAKKYTPSEATSDPPASAEKSPPRQPPQESKPRQHRLMFPENWDDYREPIKPDSQLKESDTDSDTEDD